MSQGFISFFFLFCPAFSLRSSNVSKQRRESTVLCYPPSRPIIRGLPYRRPLPYRAAVIDYHRVSTHSLSCAQVSPVCPLHVRSICGCYGAYALRMPSYESQRMASGVCPVCSERTVRNDPSLALCIDCERYFHSACLPTTGPLHRCVRCSLKATPPVDSAAATSSGDAQLEATPVRPSLPLSGESAQTTPTACVIGAGSHLDTPPDIQYSAKRRAPTPSPSVIPLSKVYCANFTAVMDGEGQECETRASYNVLDANGSIRAALQEAPAYMQVFYNLLKSSHDSNAAALAELKRSHVENSAALAENSRVLAVTTHALTTLASRVDEVAQNQQALSTRVNTDLAAVHENVSRNAASIREAKVYRSLEDPREIIVRGIPAAVQLEPMQIAAALLATLKLQQSYPQSYQSLLLLLCMRLLLHPVLLHPARSSTRSPARRLAMTSCGRHQV